MEEIKKTVCFDFDGVCATYDGWKGLDVFGEPIPETAKLVKELKENGFRCILWTTRKNTDKLREWLSKNGFDFDSINSCEHNPSDTSFKPIAKMYIDDRAFRFNSDFAGTCATAIKQLLLKGEEENESNTQEHTAPDK